MLYSILVETYKELEKTTKRLEKTYLISELLKKTSTEDLETVTLLVQGNIFPTYDQREIGIASRLILKALSQTSGIEQKHVENSWASIGDLGKVAEELIKKKKQATLHSENLTIKKVMTNLRKLADLTGAGTVERKLQLIRELLSSAKPAEARYIIRTLIGDLRIGAAEGTIRDAIAWAFFPPVGSIFFECPNCKSWMPKIKKCLNCGKDMNLKSGPKTRGRKILEIKETEEIEKKNIQNYDLIQAKDETEARKTYNHLLDIIQRAINLSNDMGVTALTAKTKGIKGLLNISLTTGIPLKVMLYQKAKDLEDAFKTVGKPAQLEYKYDGFRIQIHKNKEIKLFTRRLEDVTKQFPDIVNIVKDHVKAKKYILDGEVIGIDPKTKKWLPFQNISQRIKRKYDIKEITKDVPVMLNVFDAIMINGKNLINEPFKKRRTSLEKAVRPSANKLAVAKALVTDDEQEAEAFYKEALEKGNEGVMVKNLDGIYKPGSRVGYGVKVKPTMETLDLVIIGADWGTGKRAKWLSSFTIACQKGDRFVEMGKVGTGIKEKGDGVSFAQLTELLKPLIEKQKGRAVTVKPKIVIEVDYEEIQKSPTYSSGYALRFPRVVKLREDKPADEADSIDKIHRLYDQQRGR